MAFDTSDATYQELLARIVQSRGRVVPFVGAGLSVYGTAVERLPLWRELIDRLVAEGQRVGLVPEVGDPEISDALQAGRYIEATDRIVHMLGEPTFRRTVERELDDRGRPIPPGIAELVGIGWSLIVTTNLDRLIGRAYLERYGRPISAVNSLDTHRLAAALAGTLATEETTLAQIHGDLDMYPSWRLTKTHYQQLLQDPGYVKALEHLFLRQIFFVGFGLQDQDFDLLLETISVIYPAGIGEFYALIDRNRRHDSAVRRLVHENGLRPIFYDVGDPVDPDDPFGGHRQVYECLADLASAWVRSTVELDVALRYFPEPESFVAGQEAESEAVVTALGMDARVIQIVGLGGSGKTSLVQHVLWDRRVDVARAGHRRVIGCSFHRADIGQFVHDMVNATVEHAPLSLPDQVDCVCEHLARHRTMLVLDGLEAVIDDEYRVRNPYLVRILDAVLDGRGTVLVTTRVPARGGVFRRSTTVEVQPFGLGEVSAVFARWDMGYLDGAAQRRILAITAGHPLAVRVLAGLLQEVPADQAIATIERSSIIDAADDVDPLRENRLAQVLGSYLEHLDDAEMAFLLCSTAFSEAMSYPDIDATLSRRYVETDVNAPLVGLDLRLVIARLLDRRLLVTDSAGRLSSHPTVREFFARRVATSGASLVPIHRFLAERLLTAAIDRPETFQDAAPTIAACRHAAASSDWTLFDDLFRNRLMRGFRSHLCNNLGAWEEALELARLADAPVPDSMRWPDPAYYPVTVARCLKHLGRTSEARERYIAGVRAAAQSRDPETARYVNNLLTLLAWRGELDAADQLVEVNARALSWITEPWKLRWQTEHALSTVAYLQLLRGDRQSANTLFLAARRAWDDHPGGRVVTFDHYPLHRGELILLDDPQGHAFALEVMEPLLDVAIANRWPEAICRGHVQIAEVLVDAAEVHRRPDDLARAQYHLDAARLVTPGMTIPDVEILHLLVSIKLGLARSRVTNDGSRAIEPVAPLMDKVASAVDVTGLDLHAPAVAAARGAVALHAGDESAAAERYDEALGLCRAQGLALAPQSPRSFVGWLGARLGRDPAPHTPRRTADVRLLLGGDLSPDRMLAALEGLPARGPR